MSFAHPMRSHAWVAMWCAVGLSSMQAIAGTRPQVDLAVSVYTTPVPFVPGGIATVTMTVHNAGPDAAGTVLPEQREIVVLEKSYNVVSQPPPFVLFEPATGCSAYSQYTEYIPGLPGGGISLLNSYYFDDIAAGSSRTCTYRIQFLLSTQESFSTYWHVIDSANDDDINPSNDRFDYTFIAPSGLSASIPVPMLSVASLLILGLGLLLMVRWKRACIDSTAERKRLRKV